MFPINGLEAVGMLPRSEGSAQLNIVKPGRVEVLNAHTPAHRHRAEPQCESHLITIGKSFRCRDIAHKEKWWCDRFQASRRAVEGIYLIEWSGDCEMGLKIHGFTCIDGRLTAEELPNGFTHGKGLHIPTGILGCEGARGFDEAVNGILGRGIANGK